MAETQLETIVDHAVTIRLLYPSYFQLNKNAKTRRHETRTQINRIVVDPDDGDNLCQRPE